MNNKLISEISKLTNGRITKYSGNGPFVLNWQEWYKGLVPSFHNYSYWNGKNNVALNKKSMQMAKKICEDWADLLLNEKCNIILPNDVDRTNFDKIMDDTHFWIVANESVEHSFALGYGAILMSVRDISVGEITGTKKNDGKIDFQFVNRLNITPLTTYNGRITEAFFTTKNSDNTEYVVHLLNDKGEYDIYTYKETNKSIELINIFNTESKIAWFQIIRPNVSSNYLYGSDNIEPYISIFANSIDTLKALDTKYDSFDNEFVAGRKRIFVSEGTVRVHNLKDGKQQKVFDPFTPTYHMIPEGDDEKQFIKDESGALRTAEHVEAINLELNLLSNKVGMGEAYYKFNGTGDTTATQIISENSKLFRNLKKHEIPIEYALINLTIAMAEASVKYTQTPINIPENKYHEIKVQFDDSIIEDKATEMNRDKDLVASGLMSPIEFRERWLGETYDEATENYRKYFKYELINQYLPALQSGALTIKEFVVIVKGEPDAEYEKYIEENLDRGNVVFDDSQWDSMGE